MVPCHRPSQRPQLCPTTSHHLLHASDTAAAAAAAATRYTHQRQVTLSHDSQRATNATNGCRKCVGRHVALQKALPVS